MNILLYKGQSQYDVLRFFLDEMAVAFIKLGHNVTVIDLLAEDWADKLHNTLIQYEVLDFVFSFNAMGIDFCTTVESGQTKK